MRSYSTNTSHLVNDNSSSRKQYDLNLSTITNSIKTTGKKKTIFKCIEVKNLISKKQKSVRSTLPPHPQQVSLLNRSSSQSSNLPPINSSSSSLLLRNHQALAANFRSIVGHPAGPPLNPEYVPPTRSHQNLHHSLVDRVVENQEEEDDCALNKFEEEEKEAGQEVWREFLEKRQRDQVL